MVWKLNLSGNKSVLTVIACLFCFNFYYGQNIQVVYELEYKPNKEDTLKKKELLSLIIDIDKKESLFFKTIKEKEEAFLYQVYKNFKKPQFTFFDRILNTYLYVFKLKWTFPKRVFS